MGNPMISIIVPVYNVERYLGECVQSIVNQSYKNLEIILVDDGSLDQSPQMCDDWTKRDARIKVIHKPNGGASSARNAGLDIATGEYVGFIDSDDYIAENMFEDLLSTLEETNVKISQCAAYRVLMNGKVYRTCEASETELFNEEEAINAIFYGKLSTSMCTKLFEKHVFDGIRFPEGEMNEEYPVIIPLIKKAGGVVCKGKYLYYYREREGSVTNMGYSQDRSSAIVYKNLDRIQTQLAMYQLNCQKSFRFFSARNSYFRALVMEKNYLNLTDKVKADYKIYRKIMRKNMIWFLCSPQSGKKDKVLYLLVLTKLLRPIYKLFYRNHI